MMTPRNSATRRFATHAVGVMLAAAGILSQPALLRADPEPSGELLVYVGTYTGGDSKGIYAFRMDPASGNLTPAGVAEGIENPTFLALHPNRKYLYAVNEVGRFEGAASGAITAFAIDRATGRLTRLNQQPSGGAGPCHLVVDQAGKNVLAANYGGGSVAVLPIDGEGRLGPPSCFIQHEGSSVNPGRQRGPHAHSINLDAANRFALAADLGLDKVLVYRFSPQQGTLEPNRPVAAKLPPGAGPRHLAFHPNGRFAYVINELNSTVTAFAYEARRGRLDALQTLSTLPAGFDGNNSTADIHVHPSGKFLYGSNRGHNSIAIFTIDPTSGRLTAAGHEPTQGKTPRNFALDPTGTYLLAENQGTHTIVVFRIDPQTGSLSATGTVVEVPSPVCIQMMRMGE